MPLSGLTFLLIAAAASLSLSVGGADARDILAKKTNRRNKNSGSSRCSSSMPSGAKSMSSGGSSGSYAYGSMAGGKFKKVKAKSMKACFDACVDTANCETFVYVLTSTVATKAAAPRSDSLTRVTRPDRSPGTRRRENAARWRRAAGR